MRWRSAAWPAEFFGASSFARFTVARHRVCQKAWECFYPCETAACIGPGDYIPSPAVDPPHDREVATDDFVETNPTGGTSRLERSRGIEVDHSSNLVALHNRCITSGSLGFSPLSTPAP